MSGEGWEKAKDLSQDSRSPGRDMNPEADEYEEEWRHWTVAFEQETAEHLLKWARLQRSI
jgi:hypothetical protein